jgi:type VI secretion system secreted protein VgrG
MDASSLLADFASAFTQDRRLFSLRFSNASLDSELLPHTVSGEEHVSAPFRLAVECLASDMHRELKQLIGLGIDVAIRCGDGSERVLSGIVTAARQLGSDGGFARYGLTVEPAFAALKLHRNSRVFQDKSVPDIVGLILDEHLAANPVFAHCFRHRARLTHTYPPRNFCQQYRESDFAFIERLLREEGISYVFDFAHGDSDVGLHTLVLFDSGADLEPAPQTSIRFQRADATEADDTITGWHAHRQIGIGGVSLARFDYHGVYTQDGADHSRVDHGDYGNGLIASLQHYDPRSLVLDYKEGGSNDSELNRHATLRQQASDLLTKTFYGNGVVRGLGAGQWFTLEQHPAHEDDSAADRQFVVLRHAFDARNNLPGEAETLAAGACDRAPRETLDAAGYRNQFDAVRKTIPIVPPYSQTQHDKPTARGTQTATVVGPAGEEIFTDSLGRIKIQFHWARAQDHDSGKHGASAARDDFSSCWVRVMMPSAGAQWGHQFIPRIGQEVLVDFIEGDIDRPVVVRAIHNGQQTPPTFGNAGSLPANRTLSGIKSHEYKGSRHSEIIFDDTNNEIRATLSTEHGKTQLHQGYLIHPRSEGRGTPRGEGFELRTDNAGALRAAQGLLISTEPQPNAGGNQLDRTGAMTQLQAAQNLAQQLGATAKAQNANQPNPEPKLDTDHLQQKTPHLLLSGQGGFAATTPLSMVVASARNFDQVAQRDTHQASGRRWIHNVGESISLFVAGVQEKLKDTFKLIAAKGNILVQAQTGDVDITADKKINLTACKEKLTATAGQEFLLQSGGGYIRINNGNIEVHCPGTLSMKAARFVHEAGVEAIVQTPTMPSTNFLFDPRLPFDKGQQEKIFESIREQRKLLEAKKAEIARWDKDAEENFKRSFGVSTESARSTIVTRINKMLRLNKSISVKNFKPATPENSSPGLFAYVYPSDKDHTIFLGEQFWKSSNKGVDSTAGTLAHEMSHFNDIGPTKDGFPQPAIYGVIDSHELAKSDSALALNHADSFQYYLENAK